MNDSTSLSYWQQLSRSDPKAAAREVSARVATLPVAQQRAIWATVPDEATLAREFEATREVDGPLAGVPYALKDLFHVGGVPTRAGSAFLAEVAPKPKVDGALPALLHKAGAVLAGKTHLHEFAYGLTGENVHYGDVAHPRFPGHTSGGSSSGSAAAVAAGIVPFAVGTDTGGSIRVPAAFCGLHGLRLTPEHAWIADGFPLAPSFDTAGFFTRTATDMLTLAGALLGTRTITRSLRGCTLPITSFVPGVDPAVATVLGDAASRLAPSADAATAARLRSAFAGTGEAYGVLQSTEAYAVHAGWLDKHRERYSPPVWGRIDRGRRWTADQLHSAQVRAMTVKLTFTAFFQTYDFLVLPAVHAPALLAADCTQIQRDRLLALTSPASLAGLPVLTVPVSLPPEAAGGQTGLTVGLQVIMPATDSPVLHHVLSSALATG